VKNRGVVGAEEVDSGEEKILYCFAYESGKSQAPKARSCDFQTQKVPND